MNTLHLHQINRYTKILLNLHDITNYFVTDVLCLMHIQFKFFEKNQKKCLTNGE